MCGYCVCFSVEIAWVYIKGRNSDLLKKIMSLIVESRKKSCASNTSSRFGMKGNKALPFAQFGKLVESLQV